MLELIYLYSIKLIYNKSYRLKELLKPNNKEKIRKYKEVDLSRRR